MYAALVRPLLFLLSPEVAHAFSMACLRLFCLLPFARKMLQRTCAVNDIKLERKILGLTFPNPVGLAAGFDKDARYVDALACLGFGFIEVGTLTPRPQAGNDKPRLFRLPADAALINRMGFNNQGALEAAQRLKKRKMQVIIGGNIGKNKHTPNAEALHDYLQCIDCLHEVVDYFAVNVSSPNTPGLRELQDKEPLRQLLLGIKQHLAQKPAYRPVLLKISPDLTDQQLLDVVEILRSTQTDGVIATNTTVQRHNLQTPTAKLQQIGAGGLSGRPLRQRATEVIRFLRQHLGPNYPIIGVGGIMTPADALEKLHAGADLVQVYTGFVYNGPGWIKAILQRLQPG